MDPANTIARGAPDARTPRPLAQDADGDRRLWEIGLRVVRALATVGSLKDGQLTEAVGFTGHREEWKRLLWRLHNEGYIRVRWVGLADPDPAEARITPRGRAWIARSAEAQPPRPAGGGPAAAAPA
jgi:hypothetical protein